MAYQQVSMATEAPKWNFTAADETATANAHAVMRQSTSSKLRQYLADPDKIVVCPGVYDGISARLALNAGFDTLYMTGAGTAMSRLGMPDIGLAGLSDMKANVEMIANLDPSIPLIADADAGYGNAIMVARTVAQYHLAGAAAFHIEDQVLSKRCGHLAGKELVSEEEYCTRIRAAVMMRQQLASDIVIIARTDALHSLGFEAAVSRLEMAVELGADVAFLEAIESMDQAKRVCQIFAKTNTPVMYGMVQGSKSPHMTVNQAKEVGFKIIIYAAVALLPYFKAASEAMRVLKETGDAPESHDVGPKDLFDACGLHQLFEFGAEASGGHQ